MSLLLARGAALVAEPGPGTLRSEQPKLTLTAFTARKRILIYAKSLPSVHQARSEGQREHVGAVALAWGMSNLQAVHCHSFLEPEISGLDMSSLA